MSLTESLKLDLSGYQESNIRLSKISLSSENDANVRIDARAEDSFNYVDHPFIVLDKDNGDLVSFGCSCHFNHASNCGHITALASLIDSGSLTISGKKTWIEIEKKPTSCIELKEQEVILSEYPSSNIVIDNEPHIIRIEIEVKTNEIPSVLFKKAELISEPGFYSDPKPEFKTKHEYKYEHNPVLDSDKTNDKEHQEAYEEKIDNECKAQEPDSFFDARSMKVLLGNSFDDESPVFWEPNNTELFSHPNTGIIGTMGTGKTQLTKSIITQLYRSQAENYDGSPLGILIFDYKGDYNETAPDFVKAVKAKVLKPFKLRFNPFALNVTNNSGQILPYLTANQFVETIGTSFKLGLKQRGNLRKCVIEAYESKGIDPDNPKTWDRVAPTFDTVYNIYKEKGLDRNTDSLSFIMEDIHNIKLFESDPFKADSLHNILKGVIVFDLSEYYSRNTQDFIVAVILDWFYTQMTLQGSSKTNGKIRQMRHFILVDEADYFMAKAFSSFRTIMSRGREFGVGVILSTQFFSNFIIKNQKETIDYAKYILTWSVHNVGDLEKNEIGKIFKYSPNNKIIEKIYENINDLQIHESLVKISKGEPIKVKDRAFWQIMKEEKDKENAK